MKPIYTYCGPVVLGALLYSSALLAAQSATFVTHDQAKTTLDTYSTSLPAGLSGLPNAAIQEKWPSWVKNRDAEVRARLDQGQEDTLTNLLRYGVTYTKQPRIEWPLLYQYGKDPAATALAEKRAEDLVRGLAAPGNNDHLATMRAFVIKKGYSPNTADGRAVLKKQTAAEPPNHGRR